MVQEIMFTKNLSPLGVTFILLAMVHERRNGRKNTIHSELTWVLAWCKWWLWLKRPLQVQAICANRVFAQIAWQCRVLFACLRKLLAWNQNSLIFFAQAANACAVWVLACTNKPQYYSELRPCGCASCRYL